MSIQTINPTTGEVLETFEPYNQRQINEALDQAHQAFLQWRATSFAERAKHLHSVASNLRDHKTELARLAVLEMGKSITEAEAEVEKCAWNCDFFAEHAERFLADEKIATNATESYVAFRPLGVVLAIMPWNFPYWQVFRFAAPALMAGNTTVLKHASNVSRVALEIERIFHEAGVPRGVLRTVLVPGSETSRLIEDPRIAAVTLTGSEAAGVEVAATSGQVLKKTVLELGGSDAFIVLEDADLDEAAQVAVTARFQNNGQSCIAAKRFIVVESVAEAFEQRFAANTARLKVGDPLEYDTRVGPVAAVIHARDSEHAIELANDSKFGLGSNLWTRNIEQARKLAAHIEAGGVFINGMTASDPRLPFGGVKSSGYGRELSSFGIQEFVNIQTVWIGPRIENVPVKAASE